MKEACKQQNKLREKASVLKTRKREEHEHVITSASESDYLFLINQDLVRPDGKVKFRVIANTLSIYSCGRPSPKSTSHKAWEDNDNAVLTFELPPDADIVRIHAGRAGPNKTLVVLPRKNS